MKMTEICRKITDFGNDRKRTLIYLITDDKCSVPEYAHCTEYGVGIQILETQESAYIHNITCDIRQATELVDLLATGFVTPVSLRDIVDDWLCK